MNDLFVTFGSNASDYVGQQIFPLALIIVAAFGYSIHNHKLRKSIQPELDNPIYGAGNSENHQ